MFVAENRIDFLNVWMIEQFHLDSDALDKIRHKRCTQVA